MLLLLLRGVERKKELPEADAEDNPKKETMKENLVYEILGVVSKCPGFFKASLDKRVRLSVFI